MFDEWVLNAIEYDISWDGERLLNLFTIITQHTIRLIIYCFNKYYGFLVAHFKSEYHKLSDVATNDVVAVVLKENSLCDLYYLVIGLFTYRSEEVLDKESLYKWVKCDTLHDNLCSHLCIVGLAILCHPTKTGINHLNKHRICYISGKKRGKTIFMILF